MAFRYREPLISDFETEEDYDKAFAAWESAKDDYCEAYLERER